VLRILTTDLLNASIL